MIKPTLGSTVLVKAQVCSIIGEYVQLHAGYKSFSERITVHISAITSINRAPVIGDKVRVIGDPLTRVFTVIGIRKDKVWVERDNNYYTYGMEHVVVIDHPGG